MTDALLPRYLPPASTGHLDTNAPTPAAIKPVPPEREGGIPPARTTDGDEKDGLFSSSAPLGSDVTARQTEASETVRPPEDQASVFSDTVTVAYADQLISGTQLTTPQSQAAFASKLASFSVSELSDFLVNEFRRGSTPIHQSSIGDQIVDSLSLVGPSGRQGLTEKIGAALRTAFYDGRLSATDISKLVSDFSPRQNFLETDKFTSTDLILATANPALLREVGQALIERGYAIAQNVGNGQRRPADVFVSGLELLEEAAVANNDFRYLNALVKRVGTDNGFRQALIHSVSMHSSDGREILASLINRAEIDQPEDYKQALFNNLVLNAREGIFSGENQETVRELTNYALRNLDRNINEATFIASPEHTPSGVRKSPNRFRQDALREAEDEGGLADWITGVVFNRHTPTVAAKASLKEIFRRAEELSDIAGDPAAERHLRIQATKELGTLVGSFAAGLEQYVETADERAGPFRRTRQFIFNVGAEFFSTVFKGGALLKSTVKVALKDIAKEAATSLSRLKGPQEAHIAELSELLAEIAGPTIEAQQPAPPPLEGTAPPPDPMAAELNTHFKQEALRAARLAER